MASSDKGNIAVLILAILSTFLLFNSCRFYFDQIFGNGGAGQGLAFICALISFFLICILIFYNISFIICFFTNKGNGAGVWMYIYSFTFFLLLICLIIELLTNEMTIRVFLFGASSPAGELLTEMAFVFILLTVAHFFLSGQLLDNHPLTQSFR